MNMRELTLEEKNLVAVFANRLDVKMRQKLLGDLNNAFVKTEASDGGRIVFEIQGYERPHFRGQHSYGVEGEMLDDDNGSMTVLLFADEDDRLLELEFLRWDGEVIRRPRWETLKLF
jgi:hypothetical protein